MVVVHLMQFVVHWSLCGIRAVSGNAVPQDLLSECWIDVTVVDAVDERGLRLFRFI